MFSGLGKQWNNNNKFILQSTRELEKITSRLYEFSSVAKSFLHLTSLLKCLLTTLGLLIHSGVFEKTPTKVKHFHSFFHISLKSCELFFLLPRMASWTHRKRVCQMEMPFLSGLIKDTSPRDPLYSKSFHLIAATWQLTLKSGIIKNKIQNWIKKCFSGLIVP